jgi:hypothetical protein
MANNIDDESARWKAESDAHTLAEAHAITQDKDRFGKAQEAAKKLKEESDKRAKEAQDHSDAMSALANKMYPKMAPDSDGDGE